MNFAILRIFLALCIAALFSSLLVADDPAKPAPVDLPPHAADYPWAKDLPAPTKTLLEAYLKDQSLETFLKLRQAVADSTAYSPYSSDVEDVTKLIYDKKFDAARNALIAMAPNVFLNPRHHLLYSVALKGLKDDAAAEAEIKFCILCIRGILATGDGSQDRPYLVLRVEDEYDVLRYLELKAGKYALVEKDGRKLDRVPIDDGRVIWFDVTTPFDRLQRQTSKPK